MSKVRFLTYLSIGLFISNLILLGFMLFAPPPPPRSSNGPQQKIIQQLKLNDKQIQAYEKLIEDHQVQHKKKNKEIMALKKAIFETLPSNDLVTKDSLVYQLGQAQMEMENVHYNHFEDLKALCTAEQIPAYNDLMEEVTKLFAIMKNDGQRRRRR